MLVLQRFLSSLTGLRPVCPIVLTDESVGYSRTVPGGTVGDIHPRRACLFFRAQPYPWKSSQAALAAAGKLIQDCGYHRRAPELADA